MKIYMREETFHRQMGVMNGNFVHLQSIFLLFKKTVYGQYLLTSLDNKIYELNSVLEYQMENSFVLANI